MKEGGFPGAVAGRSVSMLLVATPRLLIPEAMDFLNEEALSWESSNSPSSLRLLPPGIKQEDFQR